MLTEKEIKYYTGIMAGVSELQLRIIYDKGVDDAILLALQTVEDLFGEYDITLNDFKDCIERIRVTLKGRKKQ